MNTTRIFEINTEGYLEIEGYVESKTKKFFTSLSIVFTLGLLRLYFYWKPHLMLKATHTICELDRASKILVKDNHNQLFIENVQELDFLERTCLFQEAVDSNAIFINKPKFRYFINKKLKYFWNNEKRQFEKLKGLESGYSGDFFREQKGLDQQTIAKKLLIYGENSIRVNLTPILTLLIKEVLSPFYVFQIFSITLWIFEKYYYFAICIFVISTTSIVYSLYSIRKNQRTLRDMIHNSEKVNVFRRYPNSFEYYEENISSEMLVPGDVIEIKNSTIMQCDAILLNGNVIVNESMLTGESIPITKVGIGLGKQQFEESKDEMFDIKNNKKSVLYSGTFVIQSRFYTNQKVKAVVLRTGFSTAKGELVRAILYPKPNEYRFNSDLYKYVIALAFIALGGMIFTIVLKVIRKEPIVDIIMKSLDLICIVIPPALPGALTASLIYAQARLKKEKIYCISLNAINVCGSVNTFVFDKTGTLTEDDCDIKCILPNTKINSLENEIYDIETINDHHEKIVEALASCHCITHINGKLDGDPLDKKLFFFTGWRIFEPVENESNNYDCLCPTIMKDQRHNREIGIIKQYPFSSSLQRMGVVVRNLKRENYDFYCKGSPEIILSMCDRSTIPKNFHLVLNQYTRKGYRVIGLAYKQLDSSFNLVKIERIPRENIEKELILLGLIIMENKLKPQTARVINKLNASNIKTIMCTGDNLLTAISVCRECGIVKNNEKVILIDAENIINDYPKFLLAEVNSDIQINNLKLHEDFSLNEKINKFHYAVSGNSFEIIRKNYAELFKILMKFGK